MVYLYFRSIIRETPALGERPINIVCGYSAVSEAVITDPIFINILKNYLFSVHLLIKSHQGLVSNTVVSDHSQRTRAQIMSLPRSIQALSETRFGLGPQIRCLPAAKSPKIALEIVKNHLSNGSVQVQECNDIVLL